MMAKGFFTMLCGVMIVVSVFAGDEKAIYFALSAIAYAVLANAWRDG